MDTLFAAHPEDLAAERERRGRAASGGLVLAPRPLGEGPRTRLEELPMKAIAVFPGKPNSSHLAELPMPSLDEVPNGRGVLVNFLSRGVDGTDKEIIAADTARHRPVTISRRTARSRRGRDGAKLHS